MKTRILQIVAVVESVNPIGAAIVFAIAYVAFWLGLAAVLIVLAFLVGLHFAKRPTASLVPRPVEPELVLEEMSLSAFQQLTAAGLECSKVEFKKPPIKKAAAV